MTGDRPFLGILLMLGFCVLAPLGDSLAKLLGDTVPLGQLLLVRFGMQALLLWPLILALGIPYAMPQRLMRRVLLRTLLHITGIGAMFLSLRFLPIADAIAIAFVMPFILLLLGKTFLNEEVGFHRLAACCVGFLGTVLVIQPNFAEVGLPALLPLVVAVVFAAFILVTRQISRDCDPVALQAVSGTMACGLILPVLLIFGGAGELAFERPARGDLVMLLGLGTLGTLAHLLMTWSLRFAPSATLAPMQYLEIPVATVFGWLIFSDLPNGLAALGIAITVAAGLFIVLRERAMSRVAPPVP